MFVSEIVGHSFFKQNLCFPCLVGTGATLSSKQNRCQEDLCFIMNVGNITSFLNGSMFSVMCFVCHHFFFPFHSSAMRPLIFPEGFGAYMSDKNKMGD